MSSQIRENLQKLFVLGISYRKTALDVRGKFSLTAGQQEDLLREAKENQIDGMVVLSTCNRTEIYAHSGESELITNLFLKYCQGNHKDFESNGYTLFGNDCIQHLYKVTSGLDSQIIGDFQIVGQVKNAYHLSEELEMANPFLNRLRRVKKLRITQKLVKELRLFHMLPFNTLKIRFLLWSPVNFFCMELEISEKILVVTC